MTVTDVVEVTKANARGFSINRNFQKYQKFLFFSSLGLSLIIRKNLKYSQNTK